jgi:hypothetical protein
MLLSLGIGLLLVLISYSNMNVKLIIYGTFLTCFSGIQLLVFHFRAKHYQKRLIATLQGFSVVLLVVVVFMIFIFK